MERNPEIRGILDTGSGVTIGRLDFWSKVPKLYPELVKEIRESDRQLYPNPIRISGIEQGSKGSIVSHYISLWIPFFMFGKPITIRIALTDNLSCPLIFGLPFIIRAKLTLNLWESYVSSPVFLGASFPLT